MVFCGRKHLAQLDATWARDLALHSHAMTAVVELSHLCTKSPAMQAYVYSDASYVVSHC